MLTFFFFSFASSASSHFIFPLVISYVFHYKDSPNTDRLLTLVHTLKRGTKSQLKNSMYVHRLERAHNPFLWEPFLLSVFVSEGSSICRLVIFFKWRLHPPAQRCIWLRVTIKIGEPGNLTIDGVKLSLTLNSRKRTNPSFCCSCCDCAYNSIYNLAQSLKKSKPPVPQRTV